MLVPSVTWTKAGHLQYGQTIGDYDYAFYVVRDRGAHPASSTTSTKAPRALDVAVGCRFPLNKFCYTTFRK
jgi:hypothetical protein